MRAAGSSPFAAALAALLALACDAPEERRVASPPAEREALAPRARTSATPARVERTRVVLLGDSLTAGLGLEPEEAFPAALQRSLDAEARTVEIVAAGVSGDTTAGGLRRVNWVLEEGADILVIALGGNDGLRGVPVEDMKANLDAIVARAQEKGVEVLLCGMEAPPNLGAAYVRAFRAAFKDVARRRGVALLPFLLEGVGGVPELNQADGIHPNARGAARVASLVKGALVPLLSATR